MKVDRKSPIEKELNRIMREEDKLAKQAEQYRSLKWKEALENKIPDKIYTHLQKAFCKAFELIFEKGTALIDKTYSKEEMEKDFKVHNYAVDLKGGKKELRRMKADAERVNFLNLAASTVEGVGLGILGIGLPDIVLFLSVILRGVYETATKYGFSYESEEEKMYILKLLEASLSNGEKWESLNKEVDSFFAFECCLQAAGFEEQLRKTADAFAVDMLLAKFVQGIPVIGIVGGLSNPVYYKRILRYVQLKYRKRYLLKKDSRVFSEWERPIC